jgi:hypothetical protein
LQVFAIGEDLMRRVRPKSRLRKLLTFTVVSAVGAGVLSLVNTTWTLYAHYDEQRNEVSRAFWERRQDAYADLVEIAARAAAVERSTEEYAQLHERFYKVYGRLEIYRTHEMGDCVTTLRDTLYACSTPNNPDYHRHSCDSQLLHFLLIRLSGDARKSLSRSWEQHPDDFADDRFDSESCGLQSLKQPH